MSSDHARISTDGPVITVTLVRQDKRNAIDATMTEALWSATRRLAAEDDLRVLVIDAVGEYFTAGIDVGEMAPRLAAPSEHPGMSFRRRYRDHHLLYDELEAVEKPVVLVAQGPCLGAGIEMAASCDFRFASTAASFALPEVRLGAVPGSGGATRLTRVIGPHWAKWLAMAGRSIDAETALRIGLVHEVHAPEELATAVAGFVAELVALPAEAVGATKLVIDAAVDADRTTQRHLDRLANSYLFFTSAVQRSTSAFDAGPPR